MASGQFNFTTSNQYIDGLLSWTSTSNGSAANTSVVTVSVYLKRNNSGYTSWGTVNTAVACDWGVAQREGGLNVAITNATWTLVFAKNFTVAHSSDGSKVCRISASGDSDFGMYFAASYDVALDKIPRYTSITRFAATDISSNSITFSWSTADNIASITCKFGSTVMYSSNTLNTNSGSFTVNGLSEHTSYTNITITVTRRDSGLSTSSSAISVETPYTPPSASLTFLSNTVNSISLQWTSNYNCDAIWIYSNNIVVYSESNLDKSTGQITLTNSNWASLTHSSNYALIVEVRRKDSQGKNRSSQISASTLSLPTINASTDSSFIIGNAMSIIMSNSSNSDSTLIFQYYKNTGWVESNRVSVVKGTAIASITPTAATLYANCTTSNTLSTRIICQVVCNGITYTTPFNVIANINPAINKPTLTGYTIQTNTGAYSNINTVIGGTTNLLTRMGNLKVNFSASSATGKNYATIKELEIRILSGTTTVFSSAIIYNTTSFAFDCPISNINTAGTYKMQINAVDSRGTRSIVVEKSFVVYDYQLPALKTVVTRKDEFSEKIHLVLNGELSKITISTVQKNDIVSIKYRYAEAGATFGAYINLTGFTKTSGTSDNLILALTKNTDTNLFLASLSNEKSYNFEFEITDKISRSDYATFLPQGKPAFASFDDGYAVVDKIPNFLSPAKLQVGSDIMVEDASGKDVLLLGKINSVESSLNTKITNGLADVTKLNTNLETAMTKKINDVNKGLSDRISTNSADITALNNNLVDFKLIEYVTLKGNGYGWVSVSEKSGYILEQAYNCGEQFTDHKIISLNYNGTSKIYNLFMDKNLVLNGNIAIRLIWLKNDV